MSLCEFRVSVFSSVLAFAFIVLGTSSSVVIAGGGLLPVGEKTITLVAAGGEKFTLGKVSFTRDDGGRKIKVDLNAPEFQDEFLSMRPFRCLPDKKEMWCHLAYPYDMHGKVTEDDLVDLEYSLLFLFKPPKGYGIDAWNGLYFKLALQPDGTISGPLNEVDLNVLAVPPDDRLSRPIKHFDLTEAQPDGHRFARVEIK